MEIIGIIATIVTIVARVVYVYSQFRDNREHTKK